MKKIIVPIALIILCFSACKTSQLMSYDDDIYTSPTEEKKLARLAALEQAKKEAEEKQKQEAAVMAQKAKDDANPYYQDPKYNSDDYYDYKYASQLRRFNNPVSGAGYYNNYYTNSYMYNQNPSAYGSSIYNSYNWWTPSNQFNSYGNGLSLTFGNNNYNNPYGNSGYNSYGYNPYSYNNPYNSYGGGYNSYGYNPYANNYYGYNPYNSGYMNGYNSGYSNGISNGYNWGYFNSYDVNSSYATYGPRSSNGGGNSIRQTSAGMIIPEETDIRSQFIKQVATQQENTPKFTEVSSRRVYNTSTSTNNNMGGGQIISSDPIKTRSGSNTIENYPSNSGNTQTTKEEVGFWPRVFGNTQTNNSEPVKNNNSGFGEPVKNNDNPQKIKNSSIELNNDNSNSSNRTGNSGNSNFNSGSNSSPSPRGTSGGGGTNHPR